MKKDSINRILSLARQVRDEEERTKLIRDIKFEKPGSREIFLKTGRLFQDLYLMGQVDEDDLYL